LVSKRLVAWVEWTAAAVAWNDALIKVVEARRQLRDLEERDGLGEKF